MKSSSPRDAVAAHPSEERALEHLDLASAALKRRYFNLTKDVESAIRHAQQALRILRASRQPEDWARAQLVLGDAYEDLRSGDRIANLERAIRAYRRSLAPGIDLSPKTRALTLSRLGGAYITRRRGAQVRNRERAVSLLREALEIVDATFPSSEWASIATSLAGAYLRRIRGSRVSNANQAIGLCEAALGILDRRRETFVWCAAMNNLCVGLGLRAQHNRLSDIERAIEGNQEVLDSITQPEFPLEWAGAQANLGHLYYLRLEGNPAENIEEGLHALRESQRIYKRHRSSADWADVTNNMGLLYLDRSIGGLKPNTRLAIRAFRQALKVRTRHAMPQEWALTTGNLGNAYARLAIEDRGAADRAIQAYDAALQVLSRSRTPWEWASALSNRGAALTRQFRRDRRSALERAIRDFRLALRVRRYAIFPFEWVQTRINLGRAYEQRIAGDPAQNLRRAARIYRETLRRCTDSFPAEYRILLGRLGWLLFKRRQWKRASVFLGQALELSDRRYWSAATQQGREAELDVGYRWTASYLFALAMIGDVEKFVETAEQLRARALTQSILMDEGVLDRGLPTQALEELRLAVSRLRSLEAEARELRGGDAFVRNAALQREARQHWIRLLQEAREGLPDLLGASLRFGQVQDLVNDLERPLLYWTCAPPGSVAVVVQPSGRSVRRAKLVWSEFRQSELEEIVLGSPLVEDTHVQEYLNVERVLNSYLLYCNLATRKWDDSLLARRLHAMGERLVCPVARFLASQAAGSAILIPSGWLSTMPLTAVRFRHRGERVCLLDLVDVALAPTARVVGYVKGFLTGGNGTSFLLAVGSPSSEEESRAPLVHAQSEVLSIAGCFKESQVYFGDDATGERVKENLWNASHVHFACHAIFDIAAPRESCLFLAHGERLTLNRLLGVAGPDLDSPHRPRLATLSACQTAYSFIHLADEVIGLPSVFLKSGVPGVLGTLWKVDDFAVMLLIERFYAFHIQGDSETAPMHPAAALARAQRWLRDATREELSEHVRAHLGPKLGDTFVWEASLRLSLTDAHERPFADPYYWGAFVFTGL